MMQLVKNMQDLLPPNNQILISFLEQKIPDNIFIIMRNHPIINTYLILHMIGGKDNIPMACKVPTKGRIGVDMRTEGMREQDDFS